MTVKSIRPERHSTQPASNQDLLSHPASLVMAILNLAAALGTGLFLGIQFKPDLSGLPLVQTSLIFSGGLVLVDLAWLGLIGAGRHGIRSGRPVNKARSLPYLKALFRPQSLTAWLIFHSAVIPLLILGPQSGSLATSQFVVFLLVVLFMG